MNRFLKTSLVLVVSIFALVSGVDCTLDHMSRSASQSSFNWYNDQGQSVVSYQGNLTECRPFVKPIAGTALHNNGFGTHSVD